MRLAKSFAITIAAALLALWLAPVAGAQNNAPQNPPAAPAAKKKAGKSAAQKAARKKPAEAQKGKPGETPAAETPVSAHRDPFLSLLAVRKSGPPLPPGKAGLVIAQIRVDGTVKSGNGMIAVVSNPQQRVYFVREGDRLYDGEVEKISLEGVVFREVSKDAFGKPVEREVTKRLYSSAGEQQ
jgi:Pilus assembly protein, PilP